MNRLTERQKRWLVVAAKLLIVLLALSGVGRTLARALDELEGFSWNVRPAWLVAAGGLYLMALLPSAMFWHRVLRALGQTPRIGETLRAFYIANLGKYVPGKTLVVVMRAGMIRSERVDTAAAVIAIFIETLTMMAVGALVATTVLAIWYRHLPWLLFVSAALALVTGLPTFPPVLRRLARWFQSLRFDVELIDRLSRLRAADLAAGWLGIAAGWSLMGLSLWATIVAFGLSAGGPTLDWPLCTLSVALAVVAGFLSFVPAGAVVREAVLLELLAPQLGEANALVAAVLLRVVWLVSDLVVSGILYMSPRITASD